MNNIIRKWIRQAQEGDSDAVVMILQIFRPLLYKYAWKYRYCYDSLDEALSTARMAVIERIYAIDTDCEDDVPREFRRAVETMFRRESRHFVLYWQSVEYILFPDDAGVEAALQRQRDCPFHRETLRIEMRDELSPCMKKLTEQERRFLYLRYVKDYTFDTIGALHGMSAPQAHKIVGRALDQMRQHAAGISLWPSAGLSARRRTRIH